MKAKALFLVSIVCLIFTGCNSFVDSSTDSEPRSDGKVMLSVSVKDSNSRTALPTFDWNDFTYELIAVQNPGEATQKDPETLFSSRAYGQLVQGILLDAAKYKFTLNAYCNSQRVLSGNQTVDLSSGNTNLSFMMYSVSGGKGSAEIKITYPKDNPVAKIEAYVSDSIFEEKSGTELSSKIVSGKNESVFAPTNLPSNKEQYAIIKFYDSNNTLIYSCAESLIILGGIVSKSSIEITEEDWHTYICTVTLTKDGSGWSSSGKTVSLVNKTNSAKVYPLTDSAGGKFIASVAEGIYYVFVNGENTEIEFNSVNKNVDVNYFTVSMDAVKKCKMIPVSGGIDQTENIAVVQSGKDFIYKISLSRGYEVSNLVVKQNGNAVSDADFDKPITINSINQSTKILVDGISPIVYTISYKDNDIDLESSKHTKLAYWFDYDNSANANSYVPPTTFTVENMVVLPTIENIRKENNYFDAWTDAKGKIIITTDGIYENLNLSATWRPAPKVDDQNKVIYANGFNLLIEGSDTKNSTTNIFVDYNGDGIKNQDDYQITCHNITTSKDNDFTGYELRAGSDDGSYVPKSDFTFTMTGGKISAIYGLNSKTKKYPNKSTLNISGTAQIGSIEGKNTTTNPDSTTTTRATLVKGIMLDTLSAERVFIVSQMNNLTDTAKTPYSVTCVSEYMYDKENEHIVAEINNSNFATLANFTCWNVRFDSNTQKNKYTQILLAHKEELINSVTRTYIRMADDSGIVLPKTDELVWDADEFHLGAESIRKPCSVFSLAVENGTFRVNERTTITNNKNDNDLTVEKSLTYMAQPTPLTYVEKLKFEENYVYMQVLSSADLLTPESVNNFLSQVFFKKIDESKEIKISVNIETVPAKYILGKGDGFGGSEFKYFNGSFYKRYCYENDEIKTGYKGVAQTSGANNGKTLQLINWSNSYNNAKKKTFNGLAGYLMNITSEVENNYIYDTFYKLQPDQLSWAGGATFNPATKTTGLLSGTSVDWWDQDVTVDSSDASKAGARKKVGQWYWQAGPEAGMCFWNVAAGNNGKIEGAFERWNNATIHKDVYTSDLNSTDPTKLLKGTAGAEPNGANGNLTNEPCLQFLAGKLAPSGTNYYYANGFWNNLADAATSASGYGCTGYVVEFTPYETEYGKQVANYQAIKRTSVYK